MNAQATESLSWSDEIGRSAATSIVEMVEALQCDYDRLEELRDAKAALRAEFDADPANAGVDFDHWARNQHALTSEECDELAELLAAAGDCESEEEARRRIEEDPLSLEMRGDWYGYGTEPADAATPVEFRILLGTGGPAVRIVGELRDGQPHNPQLEVQDWFKPWTEYMGIDRGTLQAYCEVFYFGE